MAAIIQRVLKGSPLTLQEHDDNFNNLNAELATKATASAVDLQITTAIEAEKTARIASDELEIVQRNNEILSNNTSTLASAKLYTDSNIATESSNRNAAILSSITALKGGVSSDGDTLGKLRTLITGTNTGTNTGDETTATIKSKLGITTLSGINTGDQSLISLGIPNVENKSSATIRNEIVSINVTDALGFTPINPNIIAVANGLATLDESGLVHAYQLPSYVDDVIEVASLSEFPLTGVTGKIYIALDTNKTYRWSGSTYVYITSGAVDSVAGKTGVVVLTKTDVGLGNVDNTADAAKPVSTIQQTALNLKANLSNPILTGVPTAPTAAVSTNTTQLATTAFVQAEIAADTTPITHVGATGTAHGVATTAVAGFMSADDKLKLDITANDNTGDETTATIKSKLGITTLSGSNTGDQTNILGNAGSSSKVNTISFSTTGISPDPTTFNGLTGLDAYSSTDFPSSFFTGFTSMYGAGTRGIQFVGNWNGELGNTPSAYIRCKDDNKTTWGTWTRFVLEDAKSYNLSITGNAATATKLATARTINGVAFDGTTDVTINAIDLTSRIANSEKGVPNGVATLGSNGLISNSQLPSYLPLSGGTLTGNVTGLQITTTGIGNDYHLSGIETRGNAAANTVYPSIGFHQPTLYAASIQLRSGSEFGFYQQGGINLANVNCNDLKAVGNVSAYSDERLKKDWSNLPITFLENLAQIKYGTYTRIDTGLRQAGVSAQDLQTFLPEVISDGEYLSVAYGNAALVAAIALSKEVIQLKTIIANQESRLKKLEDLLVK